MANKDNRLQTNVAGAWYVDDSCIDCDVCRQTAPDNFGADEEGGFSIIIKQPSGPDEEGLCKEAMEACPVEAIGNDG